MLFSARKVVPDGVSGITLSGVDGIVKGAVVTAVF
jgi:hypothetical protein